MCATRTAVPALIFLSTLGFTLPVSAQQFDKTFYIGGGGIISDLEPRVNQSNFQVTDTTSEGGLVFVGGDLTRYLSVEGYYRYLGESELTRDGQVGTIDYQTAGLSGLLYVFSTKGKVGLRNRTGLMLYGRAGAGYLDNSSDDVEFVRLQSTHFATGVGVEYGFNNGFAIRTEFLNHDADARDISFNIMKRFGRTAEVDLTPEPVATPNPEAAVASPVAKDTGTEDTGAEDTGAEDTAVAEAPPASAPPPPPPPDWDTDDDGILDEFDRCENTVAGSLVDASGCAFSGILKGVTFASGSAELTGEAKAILDEVVRAMKANGKVEITVESHTDNRGLAESNMDLSRRRAASVVNYLSDVGGIDQSRMSAVGYGESRPVQSNRTAVGRLSNRRVEIVVK